ALVLGRGLLARAGGALGALRRRSAVIGGIRGCGGHASGWHRWIVRGILRTARKVAPTCAVPGGRHADPARASRTRRAPHGPGARFADPAPAPRGRRAPLSPGVHLSAPMPASM